MYKNIAFVTGGFISVMIFFNGLLSGVTDEFYSTMVFHLIGMGLLSMILLFYKSKTKEDVDYKLIFIIPGILSIATVTFNNLCFSQLGITITISIGLIGQIITSTIIDHFGLFETKKIRFSASKMVGISVMFAGVVLMII